MTDLTGVYSGKLDFADLKLHAGVRLVIEKEQFTLFENDRTHTGRIRARTTFNYTAVTLAFDVQTPTGPEEEIISVRALANKRGDGISFKEVCGENSKFSLTLTSDQDKMYDVHFVTEPTTKPVHIINDLKWRQCRDREKDIKKCPWKIAGDPEKMLGTYHFFVEWSDGRFKNGELEVTSNKTFTITAP